MIAIEDFGDFFEAVHGAGRRPCDVRTLCSASTTSSPSEKPPSKKVLLISQSPRPPNSPNPTPEAGDTSSHTTQTHNPSETTSTHTLISREIISRVIQTLRLSCISKILISPTLNTLLSSVLAK